MMATGSAKRFDPTNGLRPALRQLPEYHALEDLERLAAAYGLDPADVLKLDGNENRYGASPRTLEALRGTYPVHEYPDSEQRRLRESIARYVDVDPANVVVGAGSDELIDLVFRLFVSPGDRIVTASPTFGMYAFDARLYGAEVVDVPRRDDWSLDEARLIEAASDAKAVFIPSPNNPTGTLLPPGTVDRLLDSGALLVVDEAYIEFADQESLAERAAGEAGLIVLRTFSKWGGLAGLRVGYGVMTEETVRLLLRTKQPYNVGVAAQVAALAALEDRTVLDERACAIAGERGRVADAMRAQGWIEPSPSQANFLLCRVGSGRGLDVREGLRRRGVFVRYFDTPRLRDFVRISLGTPAENDRLLAALEEVRREIVETD